MVYYADNNGNTLTSEELNDLVDSESILSQEEIEEKLDALDRPQSFEFCFNSIQNYIDALEKVVVGRTKQVPTIVDRQNARTALIQLQDFIDKGREPLEIGSDEVDDEDNSDANFEALHFGMLQDAAEHEEHSHVVPLPSHMIKHTICDTCKFRVWPNNISTDQAICFEGPYRLTGEPYKKHYFKCKEITDCPYYQKQVKVEDGLDTLLGRESYDEVESLLNVLDEEDGDWIDDERAF